MGILQRAAHKILLGYWWLRRPITFGCKGLVIDTQRRVLLVKHTYLPEWHLPGGKVEKGETALESTIREVREETALNCAQVVPRLLGIFKRYTDYRHDHIVVYIFEGVSDAPLSPRRFEIEAAQFFSLEQLPQDVSKSTRRRLDEYLGRADVSNLW